jgi:hypothetical protein
VDRADRAQLLVLLREAFGKGLLRLPDEMRPALVDRYAIAEVDYRQPLEAGDWE